MKYLIVRRVFMSPSLCFCDENILILHHIDVTSCFYVFLFMFLCQEPRGTESWGLCAVFK